MQTQDRLTNPRSAFRRDLTIAIQNSMASGHEILLLGDFNEPFGADVDGMVKLADTCGLQDLMRIRNSSTPPATYARGRTRLDYALATEHVAASLSQAGYEPFNSRFPSDHRAYFLDFNTTRLFETDTQQLGKHSERILSSNNVAQTTQYIKLKYDMLKEQNAFNRGNRLTLPGEKHQYAERLDRDVIAASLATEQKLKRYDDPAWSVALDTARKSVTKITTKCLSMARTVSDITRYLHPLTQGDWDHPFMACPKNKEGRTGAYAQTDANTTDRRRQNRQTQSDQTRRRQKSDKVKTTGLRRTSKDTDKTNNEQQRSQFAVVEDDESTNHR